MSARWRWVTLEVATAIHDRQLAEHGGGEGIRDLGLLQSALDRPRNVAAYDAPDIADLAASYAFGISRNHPFVDGNERTAWVVARLFLALNGGAPNFDPSEAIVAMESLAAGELSEPDLAAWFRARLDGAGSGGS